MSDGLRLYNPVVGRFLSVDPLTKGYPSWSPYPFAMNRVIDGVDLDGLEWTQSITSPPIGAIFGANIKAGYEQLKYSIWRNHQIIWKDADPVNIPYRKYFVSEELGHISVSYVETPVEPELTERLADTFIATLDIGSALPVGSGVHMLSKIPGWWPFAKGLASKNELLASGGLCEDVAKKIKENIGGDIIHIENMFMPGSAGIGTVKSQADEVIVKNNEWKEHFAVFKEGKYYDGLTGPDGLDLEDYIKLFPDWEYLKKTSIDE